MKNILLYFFILLHLSLLAQETIEFQNLFDKTAYDGVSCYRIPALVTAPNSDLLAAIDERVPSCSDLRDNPNINIVLRRSTDNGKTWTAIERIVDFPEGKSASDPSFIVDEQTEEIFLFYNFMDLEYEKEVYYLHLIKSNDNGKTWSEPQDITGQISKKGWHTNFKFITSGRGIQTASGSLLHTLVNLENGLHLFVSDDHGNSFYLMDTPLRPGDESKVVELEDGTLLINSRVNKAGIRYAHISKDSGATWKSKPLPELIDPACNASIIRYTSKANGYKKNRLLFANAKSSEERKNMTVRVSYDEGKTWTEGKTIYQGPSAYASLTILENGDIGLFFEKDEYTQNVFTKFSLEWLTDGKDTYQKPSD